MKSTSHKGEIYYKGHFLHSFRVVVLHVSKKIKESNLSSNELVGLCFNWQERNYHNIQSCGSGKGFLFWYDVLLPSGQR